MKAPYLLTALALWLQTGVRVAPEPQHFEYVRAFAPIASGTHACAVLDAATYAHAAPTLADLRLMTGAGEVPYALTLSETAPEGSSATVSNLGTRGGHIVFDLAMPARAYSTVDLDLQSKGLHGEDFLATALVTGMQQPGEPNATALGTFTLFDLTTQRLGRNTALALAETTFPILHIDLAVSGAAGHDAPVVSVQGAQVPPSREAQTIFTTIAETTAITQRGRQSIATFTVPAKVPVERIVIVPAPGDKTNFSRSVTIKATVAGEGHTSPETISGEVSRVRLTQAGKEIRQESLAVPATLGANAQQSATIEVAIDNEDDRPIALAAVRLAMRERKLCFDAPATPAKVFYGDAQLEAPVYDYSRTFNAAAQAQSVTLGREQTNPAFVERIERRALTERHPELLWIALLAMIAVLGIVAFRSARKI